MAIQANKPNSRIFLLLGVLLAAAAAVAVLLVLRSSGSGNQVTEVVAATSIPAGTTLTTQMVTVTQVPATAKPGDGYTDPTAVVGKTTTVALATNTPLVPAFFSTPALATTTSSSGAAGTTAVSVETQITKGYVAMAIPAASNIPIIDTAPENNCNTGASGSQYPPNPATSGTPAAPNLPVGPSVNNLSGDEVSAGFYILPGDHIDMLIDTGCSGTRFAFQDLRVLRVGSAGTAAGAAASLFIVEVPRGQAEMLAALVTGQAHPFVVKYVLRPESEWGKLAPDGSKYTPNYEPATAAPLPSVTDSTATPGSLDSLFGH